MPRSIRRPSRKMIARYQVFVGREMVDRDFADRDQAIEFARSLEKADSDDPNDGVQVDHFVKDGRYRSHQVIYPTVGPVRGAFGN